MKILVFNNGSTSSRFQFIDTSSDKALAIGGVENIGTSTSYFHYTNFRGENIKRIMSVKTYDEALNIILDTLYDYNIGVLDSFHDVDAIGHRVVHGGIKYHEATIITEEVIRDIEKLSLLAPLHNMGSLELINSCKQKFIKKENIAVFDTAFHLTIPEENYMYALPLEYYKKYGIRKYGFHGISYNYVLNRFSQLANKKIQDINTVICHLGGGCSMCAIKDGKSFDTTMGFSPLSGMIMASRSGSIDPAIITYLIENEGMTPREIIDILNTKSGYLAICNDKDVKSICERSELGDCSAVLLRKMANRDFKRNLMSMISNLEQLDAIVMTGGISAKNYNQREMFLSGLGILGINLDYEKNKGVFDTESIITREDSSIPVYVIPTDEEKEIAMQCQRVLKRS